MPLSAISDTSLARLGQDLVVTLSTTLDGVGELRTVDASTLLLNTRDAPSPLPVAQAREIATHLGAGSVLTGTLIRESGQVRAAVALYRVDEDTAIAKASTLAPTDDIAALTDSLTWKLLRQVWQDGAPPSPVLTGLTTSSFEALRHFLDGERDFQRLDVTNAITDYRRAFELDTNFVQAYLRYDAARAWNLMDPDTAAHARLLALADKLPKRERLWLEATEQTGPLPERQARWRELIQQYPDYPPILMSGIDDAMHSGPIYGMDLAETRPILDRLARLTPGNADVWLHKGAVERVMGLTTEAARSYRDGAEASTGFMQDIFRLWASAEQASTTGHALPDSLGTGFLQLFADLQAGNTWTNISGLFFFSEQHIPDRLAWLERARQKRIYTGELLARSRSGEGALRIARGDWSGGLAALRQDEDNGGTLSERMSSARLATIGAWLGTVDTATAAAAITRARAMPDLAGSTGGRIEVEWLEGLLAVVTGDDAAFARAMAALRREATPVADHAAASLGAQQMVRQGVPGAADSVRAISDAMMRNGKYLLPAEVVNRFVVARALRARGDPQDVERYLMWIDALVNTHMTIGLRYSLGPLVEFERGMALEEAGHHDAAVLQLTRFLDAVDRPTASEREMIAEARRVVGGGSGADSTAQPRIGS